MGTSGEIVNLVMSVLPPGPFARDGSVCSTGPEDAYVKLCRDLRTSEDSRESLVRLSDFIRQYSGFILFINWPIGYGLCIGDAERFGAASVQGVCKFTGVLSKYEWICFCGVFRGVLTRSDRSMEMYVFMASSGQMFGYMSGSRRLYLLSNDPESFIVDGGRNVSRYYSITSDFFVEEEDMFGHEATSEFMDLVKCEGTDDVFRCITEMRCSIFRNKEDAHSVMLGEDRFVGFSDAVPREVLDALSSAGYVCIGKTTAYQRFILMRVPVGDVYVLLSGGEVFKMADSVSAFLRVRWSPLEIGAPCCYITDDSDSDYVPVGTRVSFLHYADYALPGDKELASCWGRRVSGS